MEKAKKIVVVTGASSGIGSKITESLRRDGHVVYGTSRKPAGDSSLSELDVTSTESVSRFVDGVKEKEGRIDVLVNNAGMGTLGPAEEMTQEQIRSQFETNFFGVVWMVKAVLPLMRAQKSGQIINVSSLGGLTGIPFQAYYSATKFAIEGYSESLAWELDPFGIRVHVIEPGFILTGMEQRFVESAEGIRDYDPFRKTLSLIKHNVKKGAPPEKVSEAISNLVNGRTRRFRTRVGSDARWVPRLKRMMPHGLYSKAIKHKFGISNDLSPK